MTNETTPDAVERAKLLRSALCAAASDADEIRATILAERARHAEEARRQKELWRQETASLQGTVRKLMDQLEAEEARVTSLRSLLPDVRACAEYCRNILIGPPPLAPVALAARRILAADFLREGGE